MNPVSGGRAGGKDCKSKGSQLAEKNLDKGDEWHVHRRASGGPENVKAKNASAAPSQKSLKRYGGFEGGTEKSPGERQGHP